MSHLLLPLSPPLLSTYSFRTSLSLWPPGLRYSLTKGKSEAEKAPHCNCPAAKYETYILHCGVLHCGVLWCTVQWCIALCCTVLCCMSLMSLSDLML